MPWLTTTLIWLMRPQLVGEVEVGLQADTAEPVERVERVEDVAAVVAHEEQRGPDQVLLALADERIAEAGFEQVAAGLVFQELQDSVPGLLRV